MSKYKPLTNSEQETNLAERSAKTFRTLRKLQVKTSYYSDLERYEFFKEMLWLDEIDEKEIETEDGDKRVEFEVPDPEINSVDFLDEVAALLFPRAEIEDNLDYVDYEVVQEALHDFLSRTGRRRKKRSGFFS